VSYLRYFSLEPGNTWFPTVSSPDQWRLLRRVDATQINNLLTLNQTTGYTTRVVINRHPNPTYRLSQGLYLTASSFSQSFTSACS